MSAVPFLLMLAGLLWALALWMHRETERRHAAEQWRALIALSPEIEHCRVLPPWAPVLADWAREADWGLREAEAHAAA